MARKFKPQFKFKVGQYLLLNATDRIYNYDGLLVSSPPKIVVKILHINIYNRSNMKYVCRSMTGEIQEVDTIWTENTAVTGKPNVLKVLYGNSKIR